MKLTTKLLTLPVAISIVVPIVSLLFLNDLKHNYEELDKNHKVKVHSAYEVEINILETEKYILNKITNNFELKEINFETLEPYQTYKYYLEQIKSSATDKADKESLKLLESLTDKFMNISKKLISLTKKQNDYIKKINNIVNNTIDYELDVNLQPNVKDKNKLSMYDEIEINIFELVAAKRGYYEDNNDFFKGKIKKSIDSYLNIEKKLQNVKLSSFEKNSLTIIDKAFDSLQVLVLDFIKATDEKEVLIKQMSSLINDDIDSVLDNHIQASLTKENELSTHFFKERINLFIYLSIVILVVLLGVSIMLLNPVTKYIKNLTSIVKSGSLKKLDSLEKSHDELGFLASVIEEQYKNILESKALLSRKKEQLEVSFENLKKFVDTQNNIVILTTVEKVTYANQKFFDFFGYENLENFLANHKSISVFFRKHERFYYVKDEENWIEAINQRSSSKRVVAMFDKNSVSHIFSVSISIYADGVYIVSFTDISETIREKIKLENKTITDTLTGAYNREYFEQNINYFIANYNSTTSLLAIAMIDIDYFKKVNDNYGHDIGDVVLVEFVNTIKENLREEDILIRWGGEEFILVIKLPSKEILEKILESIRLAVEQTSFTKVGQKTCSIGGTLYKDDEDIDMTIKRADSAAYKAKEQGRNCVVIYQ